MQPTAIIEKPQILLVGFSFFGDPFGLSAEWTEENEIGRLWNRLMVYLTNQRDRIKQIKDTTVAYEVHIVHAETASKGFWEIFVGLEVKQIEDVPVELLVKILPSTQYAVFTLKGQEITSDWGRDIYSDWLPDSGYQEAYPYSFQCYDQRFKGLDNLEESILDVYVPVKPKK